MSLLVVFIFAPIHQFTFNLSNIVNFCTSYFKYRNTLFGRAIVNALRGGACNPENKTVSALDLFKFIHPFLIKAVDRINLQNSADYKPESELPAPAPVYQTPVMFLPTGMRHLAMNPICFKCDPPAAPDKPYVSKLNYGFVSAVLFKTCL